MSANSTHWADVSKWIYQVIDSCVTIPQIISARRLVKLYQKAYPEKKQKWYIDPRFTIDSMLTFYLSMEDYCEARYNNILLGNVKNSKQE